MLLVFQVRDSFYGVIISGKRVSTNVGDSKPNRIANFLLSESVSLNRIIVKYVYGGLSLVEQH